MLRSELNKCQHVPGRHMFCRSFQWSFQNQFSHWSADYIVRRLKNRWKSSSLSVLSVTTSGCFVGYSDCWLSDSAVCVLNPQCQEITRPVRVAAGLIEHKWRRALCEWLSVIWIICNLMLLLELGRHKLVTFSVMRCLFSWLGISFEFRRTAAGWMSQPSVPKPPRDLSLTSTGKTEWTARRLPEAMH